MVSFKNKLIVLYAVLYYWDLKNGWIPLFYSLSLLFISEYFQPEGEIEYEDEPIT